MKTDAIKNFLTSMGESIDVENIELYKKIIESSEIKNFEGAEQFYFAVLYPWDKFIKGFISTQISTDRNVVFIYKNSQYIDRSFARLFEQIEGSACSADKSRTMVQALIHFYTTGKKIEFDYDAEYTYHLPKKIFKTHDEIVMFYEGLRNLLSGDNRKYLEALKTVLDNKD